MDKEEVKYLSEQEFRDRLVAAGWPEEEIQKELELINSGYYDEVAE